MNASTENERSGAVSSSNRSYGTYKTYWVTRFIFAAIIAIGFAWTPAFGQLDPATLAFRDTPGDIAIRRALGSLGASFVMTDASPHSTVRR